MNVDKVEFCLERTNEKASALIEIKTTRRINDGLHYK